MATYVDTFKLVGDTRGFVGSMGGASLGLNQIGQLMASVGRAVAAPAAAFLDFQTALNQVKAVSGATGAQMDQLRQQALAMGSTTKFSATEAAQAQSFLAMAGLDVAESLGALPGTLTLAAAGNLELAAAADISTNVMSQMRLPVSELNTVVDVMAATAASSNQSVEQLGGALVYVGPLAGAAGVSLQTTAAALGLLADRGMQAEMGGTALRGVLARLLDPSSMASKALAKVGVSATDAAGNLRPLEDVLFDIEQQGFTSGEIMSMFGQRAGPGMLNLLSAGSQALTDYKADLDGAAGAGQRMADVQQEGLVGSTTQLQSKIDGLLVTMGAKLEPMLIRLADQVSGIVVEFSEWVSGSEDLESALKGTGAVLSGLIGLTAGATRATSGYLAAEERFFDTVKQGAADLADGFDRWAFGTENVRLRTSELNVGTIGLIGTVSGLGNALSGTGGTGGAPPVDEAVEEVERSMSKWMSTTRSEVLPGIGQVNLALRDQARYLDMSRSEVTRLDQTFEPFMLDSARQMDEMGQKTEETSSKWGDFGTNAQRAIGAIGASIGGVAGQIANIGQLLVSGDWVGAILAGVGALVGALKGVFGASKEELAARDTYGDFSARMRNELADNARYTEEVRTSMSLGQSESIAHAKAAFQVVAEASGRTWDEGSRQHDRYLAAIERGDERMMSRIEASFEQWREEAGLTAEKAIADFDTFFHGVTAEQAPALTAAMIDMFDKATEAGAEFAIAMDATFVAVGVSGQRTFDGMVAGARSAAAAMNAAFASVRRPSFSPVGVGGGRSPGGGRSIPPIVIRNEMDGEVFSETHFRHAEDVSDRLGLI